MEPSYSIGTPPPNGRGIEIKRMPNASFPGCVFSSKDNVEVRKLTEVQALRVAVSCTCNPAYRDFTNA